MLHNKKGAALLQVLLVAAVLAGMATMLLRVSLSRTSAARHTRREVTGQLLISRCQAEINALWSAKTQEAFARDLAVCGMYCQRMQNGDCTQYSYNHVCEYAIQIDGQQVEYTVTATMSPVTNGNGQCKLEYKVEDDTPGIEVVL